MAELATGEGVGDGAVLAELHRHCLLLFSGRGQTKIVEDGLQVLRLHSDRDVRNKRLSTVRRWQILRDEGVIGARGRS
eukprot:10106841-Lingulodinium_polyedra.AAC.1